MGWCAPQPRRQDLGDKAAVPQGLRSGRGGSNHHQHPNHQWVVVVVMACTLLAPAACSFVAEPGCESSGTPLTAAAVPAASRVVD